MPVFSPKIIKRDSRSLNELYKAGVSTEEDKPKTRAEWVERSIILPGEGIFCRFDARPYWPPVYNREFGLWKNSVIIGGRQVEKSTFLANDSVLDIHIPNMKTLFVLPRREQAQRFSQTRYQTTFNLLNSEKPTVVTDQVLMKMYNNGSVLYFAGMYGSTGADPSRGISANILRIDEAQDVIWDEVQKLQETIAHRISAEEPNMQSISGTHKTRATPLWHAWVDSTQREWFIKCNMCGKWNFPDESIIGPLSLICKKCGKPIYTKNGKWVKTGPTDAHYEGFRIPQIIAPHINFDSKTPLSINHKKQNMTRNLFLQEIMAEPADNDLLLITQEQFWNACNQDQSFILPGDKKPPGEYFAGLDWGQGSGKNPAFSILSIGRLTADGLQTVYIKKFIGEESDMHKVFEETIRLYKLYNVKSIAVDEGFGQYQNPDFAKRGLNTLRILYTTQKKRVVYDEASRVYHVDRTKVLESYKRDLVEDHFIKLANKESMSQFINDFTCLEVVVNEKTDTYTYDHQPGTHDDALHANLYMWIPAKRYGITSGQITKIRG